MTRTLFLLAIGLVIAVVSFWALLAWEFWQDSKRIPKK